jgi:hypothetical protein
LLISLAAGNGGGNDKGTLVSAILFLFAALVEGLGLLELPIGLAKPLRLPIRPFAGVMTETLETSSSGAVEEVVRIAAALSRTDGTLSSSCSVVLARGMR